MKVDGAQSSLLQGVSQQPPRDRLPGQATEQINMSSDPVTSLTRRAPTDLVGSLGTTTVERGFFNFEAKNGQKFLLNFKDSTLAVTDYNTDPKSVTIEPSAAPFLSTAGDLAFGVVENQVIVSNRSTVPGFTSARRTFANMGVGSKPMGIIQVLGGQYSRQYNIYMDGTLIASNTVADGSESTASISVKTTTIAKHLCESLTMTGGVIVNSGEGTGNSTNRIGRLTSPNWAVILVNDMILIVNNVGNTFELSSSDDQAGVAMKVMTDNILRQNDLPRWAPEGYITRIAAHLDKDDDLYLRFNVNPTTANPSPALGTGFGLTGYWSETTPPDAEYKLDLTTMPHVLEYQPDTDDFVFRQGNWKERRTGTNSSNPDPSFIGNPIKDIATFQGRLVFVAGSYVCMSRTNRNEDFFMGSVNQLVDSDPIDISSTALEASIMERIVPHNKNLVVFSRKGQFLVFGQSALTPANATLVLTTAFEAELNAKPVPAGKHVMFATNYGRFTGIREFFTEGTSDINNTRPVTQHCKEYLVGSADRIAASSNYDMVLVQTKSLKSTVYVYQYVWNDSQKVQLAWHKWTMPYNVNYLFFDQELIYFVMAKGTGRFLYRMSLDVQDDPGVGYPVHLDSKFDVDGVFTAYTMPFNFMSDETHIVVQGEGCPNPGLTVPIQSVVYDSGLDRWVVTLKYDMTGGKIISGMKYQSWYRPTMPMVKDADKVKVGTSRLIIRKFLVSLSRTGHIIGKLLSKYGDGEPVEFQARLVADPDNQVGVQPLSDEQFVMPFREDADRADYALYTDRHLPMTFLDIEYVGQYNKKGKRLTQGTNQGGN